MSVNKKNKPLYKKILKLRYPINNLNKLNRLKKSKWSNFVLQSKRAVRRRKTFAFTGLTTTKFFSLTLDYISLNILFYFTCTFFDTVDIHSNINLKLI